MLRKSRIELALSVVWGVRPTAALAQQTPESGSDVTRPDEITVSSTRTECRVDRMANTATVTPATNIEQEGAHDIKDVFRNEISVAVHATPTRHAMPESATNAHVGGVGHQFRQTPYPAIPIAAITIKSSSRMILACDKTRLDRRLIGKT